MINLKKIILEEIDNFLITENLSSLMQLGNELDQFVKAVCKEPINTLNKNAAQEIQNAEYYAIQVILAVRRCVQANNLNEAYYGGGMVGLGNLRDYGINIPPELGGNFWSDAKRGYYGTLNALTKNNANMQSAPANGQYGNINPNSVKSEKLSSLLARLQNVYKTYSVAETKFQIPQNAPKISQGMQNIFKKIKEISTLYGQLQQQTQNTQQNTQGRTP